jgi:hypothetical protein
MKEAGSLGLGFGLAPEGAPIFFPLCGSLLEWWSSVILDFRMQILDLKALDQPEKNASTSISNLQSAIINHTYSKTPVLQESSQSLPPEPLKLPAVRLRRTGNLRNVRKVFHFIAVRSLTPSASGGLRGMRSLWHFQLLPGSEEPGFAC